MYKSSDESAASSIRDDPVNDKSPSMIIATLPLMLIVALTRLLATEGVRWVGFTGTPALINSFRRLGIALHGLAPADPRRLGVDRGNLHRLARRLGLL